MCYCILLHHFIVFVVNFIYCVTLLVCMLMSWFAFVRLIKETTYLLYPSLRIFHVHLFFVLFALFLTFSYVRDLIKLAVSQFCAHA